MHRLPWKYTSRVHSYVSLLVKWWVGTQRENTGQAFRTGVQATREGRKECTLPHTHTHSTAHRTAGTDINGDSLTCSFILLAFKALTFPEEWGKWVCAAAVSEPNFLQFRSPSLSGEALTLDGCQTSAVFQDGTQLWMKGQRSLTLCKIQYFTVVSSRTPSLNLPQCSSKTDVGDCYRVRGNFKATLWRFIANWISLCSCPSYSFTVLVQVQSCSL